MIRFDKDIKDLNDRWMGLMEFIARHTLKENIIIGIFWLIFCISGSILFLIHPDLYDYVDNSLFVNMAIWLYSAMGIFFGGITAAILFGVLIMKFRPFFAVVFVIFALYIISGKQNNMIIPFIMLFLCPLAGVIGFFFMEDVENGEVDYRVDDKNFKLWVGIILEFIIEVLFFVALLNVGDFIKDKSWYYALLYIPIAIIAIAIFYYTIRIPYIWDIKEYHRQCKYKEDEVRKKYEI